LGPQVQSLLLHYTDTKLSSTRDINNINFLFSNVNKIWKQANIKIEIIDIKILTINDNSIHTSINKLQSYALQSGNYDKNKINAYFAQTLNGPNGIAIPGNVIMVADWTSVYDYRATSHEIGHVLGLNHVGPLNRLMASGVNGFDLSDEEIKTATNNAVYKFFNNN